MKKTFLIVGCALLFTMLSQAGAYANSVPKVMTLMPASGASLAGEETIFSISCSDDDGWNDLSYIILLVNTTTDMTNSCYVLYAPHSNSFYLRNDDNTAWEAAYAPGSPVTAENSYAGINFAGCSAEGLGNTLTITVSVFFKEPFAGGTYNVYVKTKDLSKALSGWQLMGTREVLASNLLQERRIRFQGMLKDSAGEFITGDVGLTLRLYDSEDLSAVSISEESYLRVPVENGLVDIELGSGGIFDGINFDRQYWLGVQVGDDSEMQPRFKLTCVPYAIKSGI